MSRARIRGLCCDPGSGGPPFPPSLQGWGASKISPGTRGERGASRSPLGTRSPHGSALSGERTRSRQIRAPNSCEFEAPRGAGCLCGLARPLGAETDVDCGGGTCPACSEGQACAGDSDCQTGACIAGKCGIAQTCKQIKTALPASKDGVYAIDPDKDGPGAPFQVWCDMTVDGGGWTSLVHLTKLDRLNYSLPHTQVGVSEANRFWILASKPGVAYSEKEYNTLPFTNFEAEGPSPTATGFTWNGVDYPNPPGCHVFQQMILVQAANLPPRSNGNPHFNPGQSNPAALGPAALMTASTINVAAVANYPSIHIGCVGWNVLKDPILWVR